jgi:sortase A
MGRYVSIGGRAVIASVGLALSLAGVGTVTEGIAVPVRAQLAQNQLDRDFNVRLATGKTLPGQMLATVYPSLPHQSAPWQKQRTAQVMPTDGGIAKLSVSRLGVTEIVLAGNGTHEQLARGPTVLKLGDTTSPVTVLAAHRDTHFHFIRNLREGDELTMQYVTGEIQRYRITHFETVRWNAFAYPLDPGHSLLALVTCYPFDGTEYGGPWRRVAWADQIS